MCLGRLQILADQRRQVLPWSAPASASGRVMRANFSADAHSQVRSYGSRVDGAGDDLLRGLRVLHQVGDDHLHRHRSWSGCQQS